MKKEQLSKESIQSLSDLAEVLKKIHKRLAHEGIIEIINNKVIFKGALDNSSKVKTKVSIEALDY